MDTPGADLPPDVSIHFGNEPDAPRRARRAVQRLVKRDDPIADAMILAVSELVANVIQHTSGGGTMRAWDSPPDVAVRLEVEDHDPTVPHAATPPPGQLSGRGLKIVDGIADAWGVEPNGDGKVIWAEFHRNKHLPPS